jgi:ubiquinone/menaquinone biosynthesis C-methylase UbiE
MNEADIQVLASIRRAEVEGEACDRATIERNEERYWMYLEDWSDSWQSLLDAGLIQGDENGYLLTDSGRPLAEHYYAERPDYFWYYYQHYYPAADASIAHSKLCERVFGQDLTQDGQADMDSINDLIAHLEIGANNKVLDLGCGAGGISAYISDRTGAHVTGLDYAATAIETAAKRTNGKQDRLVFVRGDMNALDFADSTFDAVVSVDTIYWVANLDEALASISRLLKPGGRLAIFVAITPAMGVSPATYVPNGNWVAKALTKRGLDYDVHDYTESFLNHWPKLKKVVLELKDEFIAEGNEAMVDSFMLDADEDYLPAAEAGKLRRYLYVART